MTILAVINPPPAPDDNSYPNHLTTNQGYCLTDGT